MVENFPWALSKYLKTHHYIVNPRKSTHTIVQCGAVGFIQAGLFQSCLRGLHYKGDHPTRTLRRAAIEYVLQETLKGSLHSKHRWEPGKMLSSWQIGLLPPETRLQRDFTYLSLLLLLPCASIVLYIQHPKGEFVHQIKIYPCCYENDNKIESLLWPCTLELRKAVKDSDAWLSKPANRKELYKKLDCNNANSCYTSF